MYSSTKHAHPSAGHPYSVAPPKSGNQTTTPHSRNTKSFFTESHPCFILYSSGACQTDVNDNGGPWNAGNANAELLYLRNGVLTLNYSGGDICRHNNVSRTTIINFICHDGAGSGVPTYIGNSDGCVYYFDWHTELVCEGQVCPLIHSASVCPA